MGTPGLRLNSGLRGPILWARTLWHARFAPARSGSRPGTSAGHRASPAARVCLHAPCALGRHFVGLDRLPVISRRHGYANAGIDNSVRGVKAKRHNVRGHRATVASPRAIHQGGSHEDQMEDDRSAHCLAGDLPAADPCRPQCQPMALLRGLCRGDHGPGARVDAGGCGRAHRPHLRRRHGLRRIGSQQVAAMGAQWIRGGYRLADRRRIHLLDRVSQERTGQKNRPVARARSFSPRSHPTPRHFPSPRRP